MAKIIRKNMKIFGSSAGFQQIAQIGSLASGTPMFTTDIDALQALGNYLDGWFDLVLGNNSPAIEDMNGLCYLYAYQLAYVMQAGVPEWNALTTYYIGSFVNSAGQLFVSITDNNLNNVVTDPTNWQAYGTNINNINPATQSPYVMAAGDNGKTFNVNSANGAQVFTLPAPSLNFKFTVKDVGAQASTGNKITINPHASELIDGKSSYVITFDYGFVTLESDGTNWYVVAQNKNTTPWIQDNTFSFLNFGTTTAKSVWRRRAGDSVEVRGTVIAGTTNTSPGAITMGTGLVIDSSKFSNATNAQYVGTSNIGATVQFNTYSQNAASYLFYDGSDTSNIYISADSGNTSQQFTKDASNGRIIDNSMYSFSNLVLPIVGWEDT